MILGILKETAPDESRVAGVPESVMKYVGAKIKVLVEQNAGLAAGFDDESYLKAGANITTRDEILNSADVILKIWGIEEAEISYLKAGQIIIADFENLRDLSLLEKLCKTGATLLALEKMPRLTRAQNMDILSSQNSLAGYKAALIGLNALKRAVPMMITSAGTIAAAKALVLGAGVAGLQAIATLKRMGAVVYASDVRAAAREQAQSLGARFIVVDEKADFEAAGGYSSEITPEYLLKQKELIKERLKQTDILITTALSGGKSAPVLVTSDMAAQMPFQSVIVDIAGGNVIPPQNRPDIVFIQNKNMPSYIAESASRLFSQNVYNLIMQYGGADFKFVDNDEILSALCLCFNGKIKELKQ